jgi:hypothetical protein
VRVTTINGRKVDLRTADPKDSSKQTTSTTGNNATSGTGTGSNNNTQRN